MFTSAHSKVEQLSGGLSIKTNALWMLLILALIESLWAYLAGITLKDMSQAFCINAATIGIGLFLDAIGRARYFARIAYYLALWLAFPIIGNILCYLTANFTLPLWDSTFANMDAILGFNWVSWFNFVQSHPFFTDVLAVAYGSMLPQVWVAIIFFSRSNGNGQAEELWWTTVTALIISSFISGLLPALGTFSYYKTSIDSAIHLPDLLALRDGTMSILPVLSLKGIITFPSFHAASAILLTYPYRHYKRLFGIVCTINGLMLLSTPTRGGHYLIDVIAGGLVAVLSILIFRRMTRITFPGRLAQANNLQ